MLVKSTQPKIYLRVSTLSHLCFCSKRTKIESFTGLGHLSSGKGTIAKGIKMHYQYSFYNRDFDRDWVRARLLVDVAEKTIDNIVVRGYLDDLNIIHYNNKKYSSLIELKTTNRKYMWSREIESAIKQLELYMWLYQETLEKLGFPLWRRSYLIIMSQKNGKVLRRVPVTYNYGIEEWIRKAVRMFMGLEKMEVPPLKYCKLCPNAVRINCSWYKVRMMNKQ
jgi:hypothetical protein